MTGTPQWHFLTPEYPPDPGGVADYTRVVARALSVRGEIVHVWAPSDRRDDVEDEGVLVHRFEGFAARGLRQLEAGLSSVKGERRLFVQYVPTALGGGGMNAPLIQWLCSRPEQLWVLFHEVALGWQLRRKPHLHLVHAVQVWMAAKLRRRADRIFVSIEGWLPRLGREAGRATWLPIPSNLPRTVGAKQHALATEALGASTWIAHFGTYAAGVIRDLVPALQSIAGRNGSVRFLLLGRGAEKVARHLPPGRVLVPGELPADAVAARLSLATLALQPFPDGISARRTSAMAALALGVPVVTTRGHLTDSVWSEETVALAPPGAPERLAGLCLDLLGDTQRRETLGRRGAELYDQRFSLERTLQTLLPGAGARVAHQ